MPSTLRVLVALRGEDAYDRYLTRLEKSVRATGRTISGRAALAEYALTVLGLQHGIKAPPRARRHGTNRYGEPKEKIE